MSASQFAAGPTFARAPLVGALVLGAVLRSAGQAAAEDPCYTVRGVAVCDTRILASERDYGAVEGIGTADDYLAAPPAPLDSDVDGIPDNDEFAYGTRPDIAGTDGDSFSDYHEIYVSLTDPLTPDAFAAPDVSDEPASGGGAMPEPALDCDGREALTDELGRKTGLCAPVIHAPERGY